MATVTSPVSTDTENPEPSLVKLREPPKFDDFDEIVLSKILYFLSPSERRQKRFVSSFWKCLIDYTVGLEVMVNVMNRPLMEFCSKRILSTIRVKRLTKNGINSNYFPHVQPSTWLLFPHRLRTLIVDQYINLDFLQQILFNCAKLEHVKLALNHLSSTSNHDLLEEADLELWRGHQNNCLKSLQIYHQISSAAIPNYQLICKILNLRAPNLKNFSFHFQLNNGTIEMNTLINLQMSVIKFLQNNPNLQYIYTDFKSATTNWTLPQYLVQTLQNNYGFAHQDFLRIAKTLQNLKHLVLRMPKTFGFNFWQLLYTQQDKLTKLVIQLDEIKLQTLIPIIAQNAKTLQILSLSAETDPEFGIIDLTILQNCQNLKSLHLEVPFKEDRSLTPQTITISNLPPSLERIDIGWIVLKTEDVQNMAKLPKLKHLTLVGCGEHEEFGVTIEILCDFLLANRNLEELFIFNVNHHYAQFYMRRLVNILNHLQRHNVRVHIRERAFYIVGSDSKKFNCSWSWGSVAQNTLQNQNWTRPPAVYVNKYTINDQLHIIL